MNDKKTIGVSYEKAVEFRQNNTELIGTEIIFKNFKEKILDLIIIPLSVEGNPSPFILLRAVNKKDIALSHKSHQMTIYLELSLSGLAINLFDYLYYVHQEEGLLIYG